MIHPQTETLSLCQFDATNTHLLVSTLRGHVLVFAYESGRLLTMLQTPSALPLCSVLWQPACAADAAAVIVADWKGNLLQITNVIVDESLVDHEDEPSAVKRRRAVMDDGDDEEGDEDDAMDDLDRRVDIDRASSTSTNHRPTILDDDEGEGFPKLMTESPQPPSTCCN